MNVQNFRYIWSVFFSVISLWDLINNLEQCLAKLEQPGTTVKSSIFEKWGASPSHRSGFYFKNLIFWNNV